MATIPTTRASLKPAGWVFLNVNTCPICGAWIRFYRMPNGQIRRLNPMVSDEAQPVLHQNTCGKKAHHHDHSNHCAA